MIHVLPRFDRQEWKLILFGSLVLIVLTSLPLLIGALHMPKGQSFIGFGPSVRSDTAIYLSYIEQARTEGTVFFKNAYSSVASPHSFFEPIWAFVGFIAGVFRLSSLVAFHLIRILVIFPLAYALYLFLASISKDHSVRKIAFLLGLFGSGIGLYLIPFVKQLPQLFSSAPLAYPYPVDFIMPQATTFQVAAHSPLLIISLTLVLFIFTLVILDERFPGSIPLTVMAGCMLILALIHPYDAPLILVCAGVLSLVRAVREPEYRKQGIRRAGKRFLVLTSVSFFVFLYFFSVFKLDTSMAAWARQNITPSPNFFALVIVFGALMAVVSVAAIVFRQKLQAERMILVIWPILALVLAYSPVQIQVRFLSGFSIALSALTAYFLVRVCQKIFSSTMQYKGFRMAVYIVIGVFIFTPTTLLNAYEPFIGEKSIFTIREAYRYPANTLEAMEWLRTQSRGVTLSSDYTSFVLSTRTLMPTFVSDGSQTPQHAEKMKELSVIFSDDWNPVTVKTFLQQNRIRYLFWTEREARFFAPFVPEANPWLSKIFENTTTKIYVIT